MKDLDLLILAVDHDAYLAEGAALARRLKPGGVLIDVRSALDPAALGPALEQAGRSNDITYWSL